jgi:thiazole/oxazole-forming peptide maturase SagD family component
VNVTVRDPDVSIGTRTRILADRMVSPLCGLDRRIGFIMRGRHGPRFVVAGAELTGVHVLLGQPEPGSYHIGGTGVFLREALVRSLGESVERYSQFVAPLTRHAHVRFATRGELEREGRRPVAPGPNQFFSEEQYQAAGFPFQPFSSDAPVGWLEVMSAVSGNTVDVPAQLVLVGYGVRRVDGEPWLMPAVTTGTAAHTDPAQALRNALLELVQVDAAIGHWYSDRTAPRIILDRRVAAVKRIVERHYGRRLPPPSFHWLASPDLPGCNVGCVLHVPGSTPARAVGLGADMRLAPALYKALLEAVGVLQLAKVNLVHQTLLDGKHEDIDSKRILDLDSNVAYYAVEENGAAIERKFAVEDTIAASDLPSDPSTDAWEIDTLIDAFAAGGKELIHIDLTTPDVRELGFVAVRVWSPDTLSLPLPSAPPAAHPRFGAYGGFAHLHPHPYP